MSSEFAHIKQEGGLIKGKHESEGVLVINDEEWSKICEDDLTGNWEPITEAVIRSTIDLEDSQLELPLKVERGRLVNIIIDSSFVEDEDDQVAALRATLLMEHLVAEGVYKQENDRIIVVPEVGDQSLHHRLNLAVLNSIAAQRVRNSIELARSIVTTLEKTEQDLRRSTITEMAGVGEGMFEVIRTLTEMPFNDMFDSEPPNIENSEEVTEAVRELRNEFDINFSDETETEDT